MHMYVHVCMLSHKICKFELYPQVQSSFSRKEQDMLKREQSYKVQLCVCVYGCVFMCACDFAVKLCAMIWADDCAYIHKICQNISFTLMVIHSKTELLATWGSPTLRFICICLSSVFLAFFSG